MLRIRKKLKFYYSRKCKTYRFTKQRAKIALECPSYFSSESFVITLSWIYFLLHFFSFLRIMNHSIIVVINVKGGQVHIA